MMLSKSVRVLTRCVLVTISLLTVHNLVLAQQVTYYDFDNATSSYACGSPAPPPLLSTSSSTTAAASTGPALCFNDGSGNASNPSFFSDTYPANIDPDSNPTHFAVQMTPSVGGQAGSLWFPVAQKVASGFTSYFAFKFTPNPNSFATADGIAFVLQNAAGNGSATTEDGSVCSESGSGLGTVGGAGGCMGYGGIDNSVAIELDTFTNGWDPNNNHIAVQNCGAGLANSPDHTGSCLVQLNSATNAPLPAINSNLSLTLADGNVHEVVVEYSGPTEAVPSRLRIFVDPPFVTGTHTPAATAVPVIDGVYNIAANLTLINSGSANDSAYVGFTSATGGAFEQHEVLAWTFTPHTTSTQQQPLNPPGTPTIFPFGSHTYAVTYPSDGPSTAGIDMIVTANTITPLFFTQLAAGRPYDGSQCQVYDDTGGNCIVYSISCVTHGTTAPLVACPAITGNSTPITIKSAYNNTIQPTTHGFLQGDPLYSLLTSVSGDGTTATVTCAGECSVTPGQIVTLGGVSNGAFNGPVTVIAASALNTFTFSSVVNGSGTGGFVASNNVQNVFASYVPQRIDGTTTGRVKNFSDFVVTSSTQSNTTTAVTSVTPNPTMTFPVTVTSAVTSVLTGSGVPTGTYTVSSSAAGDPSCGGTLNAGVGSCSLTFTTPGPRTLTVAYTGDPGFSNSAVTTPLSVAGAPVVLVTPSALNFGNVRLKTAVVKQVTVKNIGSAALTITDKFLQIVGGGNSKSFGAATLCPASLAPGKSCTILVGFFATPPIDTLQTATLMITDNAVTSPQLVPLTATVVKH